jgi:hypothetical protein
VPNVEKVVDDLLIHNATFPEHVCNVIQVLERCREHGITLNPKKFAFGKQNVTYVGYQVGTEGIAADPTKLNAIAKFPTPTNISELRSFMGLVNQLGSFSKEISELAEPLRPLLKKYNIFAWNANHDAAFTAVKAALVSPANLQPFDPSLPTELRTDASRTKGLGYALLQIRPSGELSLIECGSRFISETESRYAMIELELLAAVWAMKKCRIYLFGLQHFTLRVDHRPLVPVLNDKSMDAIENPRLMRLCEKILPYNFTTEWTKGKDHNIPDALSRAPIQDPTPEDAKTEEDLRSLMCARLKIAAIHLGDEEEMTPESGTQDRALTDLATAAKEDPEYQQLIQYVATGFPSKSSLPPELQPYFKLQDDLSVDEGLVLYKTRICIPKSQRRDVLKRLHASHQGVERTKRRARQTVFWPGITADIVNTFLFVMSCRG